MQFPSPEKSSGSLGLQRANLICPITLDIYRHPVLAGDGHVYERAAIIQWIEQQGTSPLTREPLDISDLRLEENMKQLCQTYRSNAVTYSCQNSTLSLPSPSVTESNTHTGRQIPCNQQCDMKRVLLTIIAISCIISPLIVATSVILFLVRSGPISASPSSTDYHHNYTYPSTTYILPNKCTLSKISLLFLWNNVQPFNYTYYSKLYKAVSTQTIITFAFRHDLAYWCLDNVSFVNTFSKTELILDGDFENETAGGFFHCNSYGNSSSTFSTTSFHLYNSEHSFCDGTVDLPDYLSQTINTKIGQVYSISFWLKNSGDAPNSALALMSYEL